MSKSEELSANRGLHSFFQTFSPKARVVGCMIREANAAESNQADDINLPQHTTFKWHHSRQC
jgi:hypothetical protein